VDDTSGRDEGLIQSLSLTLHGTRVPPDHVTKAGGARQYNMDYNNLKNTRESYENPTVEDILGAFEVPSDSDSNSDDFTDVAHLKNRYQLQKIAGKQDRSPNSHTSLRDYEYDPEVEYLVNFGRKVLVH